MPTASARSSCIAGAPGRRARLREVVMRMTRLGRLSGPGGWRTLRVSAAAVTVVGVLGAVSPAVVASSQALGWTQQHPAASPPGQHAVPMAYDAATGTDVLFGYQDDLLQRSGTWTWDGSTWTQQASASSPPARLYAAMVYDAATGTVVLFGGQNNSGWLGDTWTWDGTTWTRRTPATHPPPLARAAMAYDAATGTVVLFGGQNSTRPFA